MQDGFSLPCLPLTKRKEERTGQCAWWMRARTARDLHWKGSGWNDLGYKGAESLNKNLVKHSSMEATPAKEGSQYKGRECGRERGRRSP